MVLGASRASIFRAPLPRTIWRWCPCTTQVADETGRRSRGSIGERLNTVDIGRGPVAGVATVADVVMGLHDRRLREAQKSCEFRVMVAPEPFGDVPGSGSSRINDLIAKFEIVS